MQRKSLLFAVALAVVLVVCYWPARHGPMVFDDIGSIVRNKALEGWRFWESTFPDSTPWGRPVVGLTLTVNYHLGGLAPEGYRAVNLFLHWVVTLALADLLVLTFRRAGVDAAEWLGRAAALLWALHPLCTAAVSCIIQRAEVLMALFYILMLLDIARAGDRGAGWTWRPLIWSALGMMCKESMATAPLAGLLYDRAFLAGSWAEVLRLRWRVHLSTLAGWAVLFWCMWVWPRTNTVGWGGKGPLEGMSEALLTHSAIIVQYLSLAVWPEHQALDYEWKIASSVLEVWPSLLLVGGLILGSLLLWFRSPRLGFAGLFYFLVLVPSTSLFLVHTSLAAEHRVYLSMAALVAAGVVAGFYGIRRLIEEWQAGQKVIALWVCFALVAVSLGLLTARRNFVHRSAEALWRDVLDGQPENVRAWNNLAQIYAIAGRDDEAKACLLQGLKFNPKHFKSLYSLGKLLGRQGAYAESAATLQRLSQYQTDEPEVFALLGTMRVKEGRLDLAEEAYRKALALDPTLPVVNSDLSSVLASQERWEEALRHAEACLATKPEDEIALEVRDGARRHLQK